MYHTASNEALCFIVQLPMVHLGYIGSHLNEKKKSYHINTTNMDILQYQVMYNVMMKCIKNKGKSSSRRLLPDYSSVQLMLALTWKVNTYLKFFSPRARIRFPFARLIGTDFYHGNYHMS